MSVRWVAQLPRQHAACLGMLRLREGVEAMSLGDSVYIRGCDDEGLPREIRVLPAALYTALDDDQLVEHGRRTPTSRMPIGSWLPLSRWLQVEVPVAAFDAERPVGVKLRLIRSTVPADPNLLLLPLADWSAHAETAAEVRLRRWRFAVDERGRAVVHGLPLPPLPGRRFVEVAGVAVEAGWTWTPRLDADVLAEALRLEQGDVCLLPHEGPMERIAQQQFSPAIRSAVRLTVSALQDHKGPNSLPDMRE